jgi:hypothetical protein
MLLTFQELFEGREGGDEISSKEQSKATRTRKFRATVTSAYDGPDVVLAGMDPLGSPHPVLSNCFLVKRKVDNFPKSKFVLIATASYSTDPIVAPGSPFNDPAEISWATEQVSRIFQFDCNGVAVVNSANQSFMPGVQDTDAYWVCTVKKNVVNVPKWILNYRNAVNNSPFMVDGVSVGKYCGWMKGIGIGHVQYRTVGTAQVPYRALQFTIACKSGQPFGKGKQAAFPPKAGGNWAGPTAQILDDWWRYLLDEGLLTTQAGGGNPSIPPWSSGSSSAGIPALPARNIDGTRSNTKVLLDGFGKQLVPPTPSTAVFIEYLLKTRQNFNTLPLR